jgi:hypothetical protein
VFFDLAQGLSFICIKPSDDVSFRCPLFGCVLYPRSCGDHPVAGIVLRHNNEFGVRITQCQCGCSEGMRQQEAEIEAETEEEVEGKAEVEVLYGKKWEQAWQVQQV